MSRKGWILTLLLMSAVALPISACSIEVDRNPDGSLQVEANLPESTVQSEIAAALDDPLITDLQADLRSGYIFVTANRKRVLGSEVDVLTFRLDLGTQDGHLTATISQAALNGKPIDEAFVEIWNERLATRLEKGSKSHPNSTLQSVSISETDIRFVWRVETQRSREQ